MIGVAIDQLDEAVPRDKHVFRVDVAHDHAQTVHRVKSRCTVLGGMDQESPVSVRKAKVSMFGAVKNMDFLVLLTQPAHKKAANATIWAIVKRPSRPCSDIA